MNNICDQPTFEIVALIDPVRLEVTLVVAAFLFVSAGSVLCHVELRLSSFLGRVPENRGSRRLRQQL